MGSSCYDERGNLTSRALSWEYELASLTPKMINTGILDLSHLANPAFPPSAIEFVKHCRERFIYPVIDEVMAYVRQNDKRKWEWSGRVPWNVYKNLHYNPMGNETQEQLRSRVEKVYRGLSWHNLDPLPDYSQPALQQSYEHPINNESGYRQFCGRIAGCIKANATDLGTWAKQVETIIPRLSRQWWPEFKQSEMKVIEFLRHKGLDFPVEPNDDDIVQSLISKVGFER